MGRKKQRFYSDHAKGAPEDTNVDLIDPKAENALPSGPRIEKIGPIDEPSKLSKRRQKEMEKYVIKKLKQDSRPQLMERLQKLHSGTVAGSLQSTKNLHVPSRQAQKLAREPPKETEESSEEGSGPEKSPQRPPPRKVQLPEPLSVDLHAAIADIRKSSLNPLADLASQPSEGDSASSADERAHEPHPFSPSAAGDEPSPAAYFVLVERKPEIEAARAKLPIYAEEQAIMEQIRRHPVVVICGETGSGKTTQVPQFLYEAGYGDSQSPNPGLIGVTQPRRIAAISMARRVAEELGKPEHVAHQVRYDTCMGPETRIKFMTDGILLRELSEDFLLKKYSAILLDEAHERNLNTDILIGMLSRIVRLRCDMARRDPAQYRPLRLVIMSATLNVEEFTAKRLFDPPPPVLSVEARQHPVTIHFARKTNPDYVEAARRIVRKIHANLPPGGILVFMTGKQEIVRLANKLQRQNGKPDEWVEDQDGSEGEFEAEGQDEAEHTVDSDSAEREEGREFDMDAETNDPLHILPMYSLLAPEEQLKVFQEPPEGSRLCVIATNVAETSLTIPNIRYVVDCGRVKQRHYDPVTGAQQYRIEWTSKASAVQRSGRAGRVGPGHCYRLYSSAVFDQQCPAFSVPEIQRTPIEGLVLQLKTMSIDRPEHFPLPSAPDSDAVIAAQNSLIDLGALVRVGADTCRVTRLGRMMAKLPLIPAYSRLVAVGAESGMLLAPIMALASAMTVGDPFLESPSPTGDGEGEGGTSLRQVQLNLAGKPATSDVFVWLMALIGYMRAADKGAFCALNKLIPKRLEEMAMQYKQLERLVKVNIKSDAVVGPLGTRLAISDQEELRKLLAGSLAGQVAERVKNPPASPGSGKRLPFAAYRLRNRQIDDPASIAYLHPTSVLSNTPPKYIVYIELAKSTDSVQYVKNVTAIEAAWLGEY